MALKLDDRPEDELYDDGSPSWRTDMQGLEESFDAPSATDSDLPEGHPSRSGSDYNRPWAAPGSNDSLAEREAKGGSATTGGGYGHSKEDILANKHADGGGTGWATNIAAGVASKSPYGFIAKLALNKRKAFVGGGVTGTVVGLFAFASMIASGPLQLIHAAQLLDGFHMSSSEEFGDSRRNNLFLYARNYKNGTAHRNNLGFFSNQLADRYDAKLAKQGITQVRDNTRSLQRLEIDTKTQAGSRLEASFRDQGIDFDGPDADGKITVHTRGDNSTRLTRTAINESLDAIGLKGKSARVGRVLLRARNGASFHPFKNKAREKSEKYQDWRKKKREERAQKQREGSQDIDPKNPEAQSEDADGDGNKDPSDPADVSAADDAGEIIDDIGDIDIDTVDGQANLKNSKLNLISRLGPAGTAAAGAAAVIGISCAVKDIGNSVEDAQYANKIAPLVRRGVELAAAAGQAQAGEAHLDEIGEYLDDFYDEAAELNKDRSFFNAKSIQVEDGKPNPSGPDISEDVKPSPPGEKDLVFELLDGIPLLSGVCSATEWASGLPIIKQIGDASNAVISGGLEAVTGKSLEDYVSMLVNYLAGAGPNLLAQGAEAGNLANIGTFLLNNEQMMSSGGAALSPAQSMELKLERLERNKLENRQKTLFARLFDINDAQSLVAKAVIQNPDVASVTAMSKSFTSVPSKIVTNFASILTPRAHAAAVYDYGVPEYGYSATLRDDPRFADPYANADIVEPKLDELTEEYGDCFDVKIDTTSGGGNKLVQEESDGYPPADIADKCRSNDEMLLRFRFYIADTVANKSLVCLEGIDENACKELGYGVPKQSSGGTVGGSSTITGVECPANLEEAPGHPGYFKLPPAPNGEYSTYHIPARGYGSKQLVCVLYTVGLAYQKAMNGKSRINFGDLNAAGHKSHQWGVAIDLDGIGEIAAADTTSAAQGKYSTEATATLGKLFVDTGVIKNIWWCDSGDGSLNQIIEHAKSKGTPLVGAQCIEGHYNHFHIDILDTYKLESWEP